MLPIPSPHSLPTTGNPRKTSCNVLQHVKSDRRQATLNRHISRTTNLAILLTT